MQSQRVRYRFDAYTLDPASGELYENGRRVELQNKPFELLVALVTRAGDVVTREQLRDLLWPDGLHVDYDRGLANAVQKLRQALGDPADSPRFVETLPRRGYRFLAPVGTTEAPAQTGRPRAGYVIALAILGVALALGLVQYSRVASVQPDTENARARDSYQRATHFFDQKTVEGVRRSVAYYREAIEADPDFARAWSGLAYAYHFLGAMGVMSKNEAYERARTCIGKSLERNASLADAHALLAEITYRFGDDDGTVEPGFQRAIELDPDFAPIRHWYGNYLSTKGRLDEGLEELRRALELDPLSRHIGVDLAIALFDSGRPAAAWEQLAHTEELDPSYPKLHQTTAYFHWKQRRFDEAVVALRRVVELAPGVPKYVESLAAVSLDAGDIEGATATLSDLKELANRRHVPSESIERLEARLRQAEQTAPLRNINE